MNIRNRFSGKKPGGSRFSRDNNKPRGNFGGNKRKGRGEYINESLFINKAKKEVAKEVYVSKHTFADFGLDETLLKNITAKGYVTPSPIQDQTIPLGMQGKDVIGIANTGTGKTAAFLLPLIHKLVLDRKGPAVLVLAPTRELAQQIEEEFKGFTKNMKLYSVTCVGGAPIGKQIRDLSMGVDIIIGTPGRVKDLIKRGKIVLSRYGNIVLDEADRMLDMGFIHDIREILGKMPADKQGLFFSATFSPEIKNLCNDFLKNPVTISVKTRDTASNVDQDIVRTRSREEKLVVLQDILSRPECKKVLIFREMKRSVDELGRQLSDKGFKALALHGDMRNKQREHAVKSLAVGSVQVVIATDVAARGIDIPDITHVINYDIPQTYDTYVHRIGRTGRGDKSGVALTFI